MVTLVLRYTSNDGYLRVKGAMPKSDEVGRGHADAANTWQRPGAPGLGHDTHQIRC